jgi:gamma-glutamylcyclotransferase (GGCT)/AIG2-like uncharacterized protein YtfP
MRLYDVAVYGSLREGFGNHRLLKGAERMGLFLTDPEWRMFTLGGFPAIVPAKDGYPITVEVYTVGESTLADLDRLEGYPGWYKRECIGLQNAPDDIHPWIYFFPDVPDPDTEEIISGDWREYRERKA